MSDSTIILRDIVAQLNVTGKMHYVDGATEEQIVSFENKHKLTLPSQYRQWLLLSDGGELFLPAGIQLYGVAHKPLIDINDDDRPNDQFVALGRLASGDPVLFSKTNEQISIYNHEAGRIEKDEIYPDFFAFLSDLSKLLGIED